MSDTKLVALTGRQLKELRLAAGRTAQPVNKCQHRLLHTRPGSVQIIAGIRVVIERHQCSNTARWLDEISGKLVCGAHANYVEDTHHDHPTPIVYMNTVTTLW